ncbi:MAG: PASTA domain-containing protein [Thermoleophilaceae bacterium]
MIRFTKLLAPCVAVVTCLALFAAAPALATVTGSQITSVTTYDGVTDSSQNPIFSGYNDQAPQTTSVTGTATTDDNNASDFVDVRCVYGNGGSNTLASNVPVAPDGTFAASGDFGGYVTCHLVAFPHNYNGPNDFSSFHARTYGVGEQYNYTSGGHTYDYYVDQHQLKGYFYYYSVGDGGICWSNVLIGLNFYDPSDYSPFDCGLGQYTYSSGDQYGRSEVQVDGVNSYNTYGATNTVGTSSAGFPDLTWSRLTDPNTGNLSVSEREQLVNCGSGHAWPATSGSCTGNAAVYTDTGVRFDRQIQQSKDGLQTTLSDTYTSTDGNAHSIDVEYDNYVYENRTAGLKVPGSNQYVAYTRGDVIPLPAQSTGTIYVEDTSFPQGNNPYESLPGSYTYETQPDRMFVNSGYGGYYVEFVLQYRRTVPANGSVTITHVGTQGLTPAEVASLSDTSGPSVAITSPPNGAQLNSGDVTVTGTAADDTGVTSLTVNGVPTSLNPDGTWSQHLSLGTGGQTITAVAKDAAGNTGQAQETVNVGISQCTVPKVTNLTTAQAAAALQAAGCTVGAQLPATSRTVPAGQVIAQSIPAGLTGQLGLPVDITVSLGKFTGARLVSRSVKLNGRSLVLTVRCGSSPVQTGTVKLRTSSGGKKRTLGTAPFACPSGKKRTVHFTISGTSAKALKRNGKTKAIAFIVARNTTGDTAQQRGRLVIRA